MDTFQKAFVSGRIRESRCKYISAADAGSFYWESRLKPPAKEKCLARVAHVASPLLMRQVCCLCVRLSVV